MVSRVIMEHSNTPKRNVVSLPPFNVDAFRVLCLVSRTLITDLSVYFDKPRNVADARWHHFKRQEPANARTNAPKCIRK